MNSTPAQRGLTGPAFSLECRACARLAAFLADVRRLNPGYHGRPVASFGAAIPRLLVVGLAPGMHGANRTGRPFTGDHAGILLYRALHRAGFSSKAESIHANDGLRLYACRITNAVKCLPPANKPSTAEVRRCNAYLRQELFDLRSGSAILALGGIAHKAVLMALGLPASAYRFGHGERHRLPAGLTLFDSYHCSRYNTQTGRLTVAMFESVMARISRHLRPRRPG